MEGVGSIKRGPWDGVGFNYLHPQLRDLAEKADQVGKTAMENSHRGLKEHNNARNIEATRRQNEQHFERFVLSPQLRRPLDPLKACRVS